MVRFTTCTEVDRTMRTLVALIAICAAVAAVPRRQPIGVNIADQSSIAKSGNFGTSIASGDATAAGGKAQATP